MAAVSVRVSNPVLEHARQLQVLGLGEYDSLHVACAIQAEADVFVSTDDRLVSRMRTQNDIRALLPGDALAYLENWYEN